jgi:hypothetical protein
MPRFQSWLFNSVDRSLPVQLGRRARRACQQLVDRFTRDRPLLQPSEVWAQVSRQVAKVVLYPVYLIAIATKRSYKQLSPDRRKPPPLLLRPFQQLVVWAETTDLYAAKLEAELETALEQNLELNQLTAEQHLELARPTSEQTKISPIAPSINNSPQIWQAQPKTSQPQAFKSVSIAYEQQLERIRHLIKAAIDYFFGKKPTKPQLETVEVPSQPWLSMADLFDDGEPWPQIEPRHAERSHEQLTAHVRQSQPALTGRHERSLTKRNPATTTSAMAAKRQSGSAITSREIGSITSSETGDRAITSNSNPPGEMVPDLSGWLEEVPDLEPEEPYRTLQAWIETQATFLGYVYSPIMEFIHRLDRLIARFEQWLVSLWQKLCQIFHRKS